MLHNDLSNDCSALFVSNGGVTCAAGEAKMENLLQLLEP